MAREVMLAHWRKQMWDNPDDDTLRLVLADHMQDAGRDTAAGLIRANVAWRVMIREQDWSKTKPHDDARLASHAADQRTEWDHWAICVAACRKAMNALAGDPFAGIAADGSWAGEARLAWGGLAARLHQAEVFACGLGARETDVRGGSQQYRLVLRRRLFNSRAHPIRYRALDLCMDAYEALVLCPDKPIDPQLVRLLSCAWNAWSVFKQFSEAPSDPAA